VAKILQISNLKANLCIRLFLLASFVGILFPLRGQTQSKLSVVEQQFLNFELDSCLESLQNADNSPLNFYIRSLIASSKIFVNDDPDEYVANRHLESDLLDELSKQPYSEEYSNFLKAEIKLQWAILKFRNGDQFSASWSLKHAYNIAESNIKKHPEFMPSYKTLGLLHVLYGSFPDKYDWILSLLGLEDDVEKGLGELELTGNNDPYFFVEATIIRALLHSYLLNDPQKGPEIIASAYAHGNYLLLDYAHALLRMKNAESDLALKILDEASEIYTQPFRFAPVYHAFGEILLQKGNHREAIDRYRQFLLKKSSGNLVKDAYYKIGICYYIDNMTDSASSYFEASKIHGQTKNEADRNAKIAVESGISPNRQLLQLRYATDGGYYDAAFNISAKIDPEQLDVHDKCEYWYRSARLHHRTGSIDKALQHYQKAIDEQHEKNWYFAPNSCLQSALIHIKRQEPDIARKYLEQVDDYSGYPYQNSIRQKTKTVLRQLN
jgi:tetratricopeptide (TPR) repeat protein